MAGRDDVRVEVGQRQEPVARTTGLRVREPCREQLRTAVR